MIKSLFSILLGFGLATLFRKVCKGNCITIKGPPLSETNKYYYKYMDECYKYNPYEVECENKL